MQAGQQGNLDSALLVPLSHWSGVIISWSDSLWQSTDLQVHRDFLTFVLMYRAVYISFSKQIFNNIFIITEQGNNVQYPCDFGGAWGAAIITSKSIFYIHHGQHFSKVPVMFWAPVLSVLILFCLKMMFLVLNFCWVGFLGTSVEKRKAEFWLVAQAGKPQRDEKP